MKNPTALVLKQTKIGWTFFEVDTKTLKRNVKLRIFSTSTPEDALRRAKELSLAAKANNNRYSSIVYEPNPISRKALRLLFATNEKIIKD